MVRIRRLHGEYLSFHSCERFPWDWPGARSGKKRGCQNCLQSQVREAVRAYRRRHLAPVGVRGGKLQAVTSSRMLTWVGGSDDHVEF